MGGSPFFRRWVFSAGEYSGWIACGELFMTRPIRNRNTYLSFLASWDQFQEYRRFQKYRKGSSGDPLKTFPGMDLKAISVAISPFVTSKRPFWPSEVSRSLLALSVSPYELIYRRRDGSFGPLTPEGESFGSWLDGYRAELFHPDNKNWQAIVVLATMTNDVSPKTIAGHCRRCGLTETQFREGVSAIENGVLLTSGNGSKAKYIQGTMHWKGDLFRLPGDILTQGDQDDVQNLFCEEPDPARLTKSVVQIGCFLHVGSESYSRVVRYLDQFGLDVDSVLRDAVRCRWEELQSSAIGLGER